MLHDASKKWRDRVLEAQQSLADIGESATGSFVAQVRKALAEDSQRVRACLSGLRDLEFGGKEQDPGFQQWQAWVELNARGVTELTSSDPIPDVGKAWHGLVRDLDPRSSYRAFEACTMMSVRKSLRRGSVWIDHSLSFRARDHLLIPPDEWAAQREHHIALLGVPASARDFLEPLLANLTCGIAAVAEAHRLGQVEIGTKGV